MIFFLFSPPSVTIRLSPSVRPQELLLTVVVLPTIGRFTARPSTGAAIGHLGASVAPPILSLTPKLNELCEKDTNCVVLDPKKDLL